MLVKRIWKNFTYWLWFYLLKKMQHFDFDIMSWQIKSRKHVPNFITISLVLQKITRWHLVFFWFTVLTAVHLQTRMLSFTRYGKDTIQVRQKTFTFPYNQLLRTICTTFYHNQSRFVDCISKNILVCFFGSQCSIFYSWMGHWPIRQQQISQSRGNNRSNSHIHLFSHRPPTVQNIYLYV